MKLMQNKITIILTAAIICLGVVVFTENQTAAKLRNKIRTLNEEGNEKNSLMAENERLSKLLAEQSSELNELLALRSEITMLRQKTNELSNVLHERTNERSQASGSADAVKFDPETGLPLGPTDLAPRGGPITLETILATNGPNGNTPLHRMAFRGSLPAIEAFLRLNPNVNIQDQNGHTPLYDTVASRYSEHSKEIVLMLLQHGADPNIADSTGKTPIQIAIEKQRSDLVELLQQWGAKK